MWGASARGEGCRGAAEWGRGAANGPGGHIDNAGQTREAYWHALTCRLGWLPLEAEQAVEDMDDYAPEPGEAQR